MIRKLLLATAALFVLGPSPAVRAGQAATAWRPDVPALAHELELATGELQRSAEIELRRRGRYAYETFARLDLLDHRAARFHFAVERFGVGSPQAERDLVRLLSARDAAAERLVRVRSFRVRSDFERVLQLTDRVVRSWDLALRWREPPVRPVRGGAVLHGESRDGARIDVRARW